jgi:hypothetical protein
MPAQAQPSQPPTPTPAPTPPTNAQWTCKASIIDPNGTPTGPLAEITVGEKFLLACEGPPAALKRETLSLETSKEARFALRILETKSLTESRGEFIATSWVANEFTVENPVITDGQMRVGLGDIQLKVASVIKPEQNPEGKPFGPWGPASLPLPTWVWLLVFAFLVAVVGGIGLKVARGMRRKKFLKRLEAHRPAMSPYNQFNKDLRRLLRTLPLSANKAVGVEPKIAKSFLMELSEALRWLLARELLVDTLDTSPREILGLLARHDKDLHKALKKDMHLTLTEIDKALAAGEKSAPPLEDLQQIGELARKLADKVQKRAAVKGSAAS